MSSRGTKYWNSGAIPLIAPEILGDIIADLADLAVMINDAGVVLSVLVNAGNDFFRRMEKWETLDFRKVLASESIEKFDRRLAEFLGGQTASRPVELNHSDEAGRWEFPVRYTLHRIGPEGAILLLGRDLRPIAEMQRQLVKAQIALERDYEAQREFDTRFRVMMEATREALVFVSVHTGNITDLNSIAATQLGRPREELVGSPLADSFSDSRKGELIVDLAEQALADRPVAVRALQRRTGEAVDITPTLFRAAGERFLLCRIEAEEAVKVEIDSLTQLLGSLYQRGPDAILFTDQDGTILWANESLLDLIDAAHDRKVRGRSLADFLSRGSVDLRVMIDNASRAGRLRMFPTRIAGEFAEPRAVEIAVTLLPSDQGDVFGYVVRDASRSDSLRPAGTPGSDENVRSVMELVGSATLKDIVAETTDVIERMCIETAVELTMNNRVAAAEMLGLSRQSLYVKLRKYDLLHKGQD